MEKMKGLCYDKLVTKRRCIKLFTLRMKVYSCILVWRACSACRRIPWFGSWAVHTWLSPYRAFSGACGVRGSNSRYHWMFKFYIYILNASVVFTIYTTKKDTYLCFSTFFFPPNVLKARIRLKHVNQPATSSDFKVRKLQKNVTSRRDPETNSIWEIPRRSLLMAFFLDS